MDVFSFAFSKKGYNRFEDCTLRKKVVLVSASSDEEASINPWDSSDADSSITPRSRGTCPGQWSKKASFLRTAIAAKLDSRISVAQY